MNELHFGMLGMFVKRYIFTGAVWKNRSSASAADTELDCFALRW